MGKHADEALKLARKKGMEPGAFIPIAVYDEDSFSELRNPDGMSFEEHQKAVADVIDVLASHGFNAVPVKLSVPDYKEWLGEDLNTSQKRAEFVAQKLRKLN